MSDLPFAPDPKRPHRMVGFGLGIVALGWLVLAIDLVLSDAILQPGNLVAVLAFKADVVTLSQTLIVTGLGLALLGALRDGFGALTRFFDAVLQRSTTPRPAPVVDSPPGAPIVDPPSVEDRGASATPRDRNYVILPDGSVEVETLLGTRVFATMDEARQFIR